MTQYIYEATNKNGEVLRGEIKAVDQEKVIEFLIRKNLTPIKIDQKGVGRPLLSGQMSLFERFTTLDRIIMVRNLAATIKAGLSMIESLDILIKDSNKKITKKILTTAKTNVQNGQPLSSVFITFGKFFPTIFIGMVKAGEASGQLDKALDELSQHMTKEYNLTKKVKSALAYPFILLVASILVTVLLLIFVLPRLAKTFRQTNFELPAITKFLVKISNIISYSIWLDLGVLVFIIWLLAYFRKTKAGKRFFSRIILTFPATRNLAKKVYLVRFSRSLGSLITGAMPIIESLELTAESVGNEKYRNAIRSSIKDVKSGMSLHDSFKKHPELFPGFLTSLMAVGERTGTLERVLKTFADFHEQDVDSSLKDLTTFLEPLLLLVMGFVVGAIALSILLPIYQLVGKFI